MIKQALFGLLLASSTAAVAQTTQPATDPLAPSTPVTTPSGTAPATPATPADPATGTAATPATPAVPGGSETAAPTDAAGIVAAEWASYDVDSNKQLNKAEFGKWITTLQSASGGKAPTSAYLTGAFRSADTNKSGGISEAELVKFLGS